MIHPFDALQNEYASSLSTMTVIRKADVDRIAHHLLGYRSRYEPVHDRTGIPVVWIASSFEREASSNFLLSPAQGDPWASVSTHVPKGRGPFPNWQSSAFDAYHLNGLDAVGAKNWTLELCCYYDELFNGFGYRDYHKMPSPYLWGGTNHQTRGKYDSDGKFNPNVMDTQIGTVPVMARMIELDPTLAVPRAIPAPSKAALILQPTPAGVGGHSTVHDTRWIQTALNTAGFGPALEVDGSYGYHTWLAVRNYQVKRRLTPDGYCGKQTLDDLETFLTSLKS